MRRTTAADYDMAEPAQRDQYNATLGRMPRAAPPPETFVKWPGQYQRGCAVPYFSGVSIDTFKTAGKYKESVPQARAQSAEGFIPGYTGFIRGRQHVSGRTFGSQTSMTRTKDYDELVTTSPIPSNPPANRKISQHPLPNSFMTGVYQHKEYSLPGYTGHHQGIREYYGKSYGSITRNNFQRRLPGQRVTQERDGYAYPTIRRMANDIALDVLPGALLTHKPPQKLVAPQTTSHMLYFNGQ